jgi:hypothetical protein
MNIPEVLYRVDGAKFVLQPNGKYEMEDSMMDTPYQYPLETLNTENFSPTLEEAKEKERCRQIGLRFKGTTLQKFDGKKWVTIPTVF